MLKTKGGRYAVFSTPSRSGSFNSASNSKTMSWSKSAANGPVIYRFSIRQRITSALRFFHVSVSVMVVMSPHALTPSAIDLVARNCKIFGVRQHSVFSDVRSNADLRNRFLIRMISVSRTQTRAQDRYLLPLSRAEGLIQLKNLCSIISKMELTTATVTSGSVGMHGVIQCSSIWP